MPDLAGVLYNDAGVPRDLGADTVAAFTVATAATETTATGSATSLTQTDSLGAWTFSPADGTYDVRIIDGSSVRWRRYSDRVQLREIWVEELQVVNQTEGVSNQLLLLRGNNATRAANDEIYVSFSLDDSGGGITEFARLSAVGTTVTATSEVGALDLDLMSAGTLTAAMRFQRGGIRLDLGLAITAGDYFMGRDADATNQLHLNVPTGATMELSVNDVSEWVFGAAELDAQGNNIVDLRQLQFTGSTSGALTHAVPAAVTSHTLTWPAAQGAASTNLQNDGSGGLTWVTAATSVTEATQADQEDEGVTNANRYVSPETAKFAPSAAKAWCSITAAGALDTTPTDYGISTIGDTGVGDRDINYSTAFSAALVAIGSASHDASGADLFFQYRSRTTADVNLVILDTAAAGTDAASSQVWFGDL